MAFKMKGFNKPPSGQDIVKSKEEQIKDLLSDIEKLKKRNNPGDDKRIKILEAEIKRLQG
jgi:hypothetical protein